MGFFKRLFKKKDGYSRLGRLWREVAYNVSGGLIGEDTLEGNSTASAVFNTARDFISPKNRR